MHKPCSSLHDSNNQCMQVPPWIGQNTVLDNIMTITAQICCEICSHASCLYLLLMSFFFHIADRNNLSLNSMKKRQRTKKFPMTVGSWTSPEGPTGKTCTVTCRVALYILSYCTCMCYQAKQSPFYLQVNTSLTALHCI